jgi:thiol-disulfide isomerase/thioredoxin
MKQISSRHLTSLSTLALLLACTLTACTSKPSAPIGNETATEQTGFPYPEIPNVLTTPSDRLAYLTLHFWDRIDMADTTLILHTPDITEQGLSDYLSMLALPEADDSTIDNALRAFCTALHGHAEAQQYFVDQINDYLFDVNSPAYSEAIFGRFLRCMTADTAIDEVHRQRFAPVLEVIGRNNPGQRATDFCYTLPDGRLRTLLGTPAAADRLLLLFYDPDCEHCREVLAEMTTDPTLANALSEGRLALLAVYTEGDEALWHRTLSELPPTWQVGYDAQTSVRSRLLYDLKAMPTLYLMDGEHTILLKDPSFADVRATL